MLCLVARIPLNITGPPGCGKTLAVQTVVENMKGSSSPTPLFVKLPNLQQMPYTCSESSTASEVASVFDNAVNRARAMRQHGDIILVFLDEAGLPSEKRHALKVIHAYLDHSEVACIMLANSNMDAAKLNRCLQVSQSAASETDLLALAEGCLFATDNRLLTSAAATPPPSRDRLRGLCRAFQDVQRARACWAPHPPRSSGSAGLFHQRDFVYLLRNLRRQMDRAAANGVAYNDAVPFTAEMLLSALRRNFGGISEEAFALTAGLFLRGCGFGDFAASRPEALQLQTVATLRESLSDAVEEGDDPNTSAFRHILLLDPTDVEVSVGVLFELGLLPDRASTCVVTLSEYAADSSDLQRSQAVASIKAAAELGQTVLLTNPGLIASSIFDLLNKHYLKLTTMDDQRVPHTKYYANIAIGSYSRLCAVHPDFRIIVHTPLSAISRTPLPFLNRFEKFTLSCAVALEEKLSMMGGRAARVPHSLSDRCGRPTADLEFWRAALAGVEDFAAALVAPISMPGFVPFETVAAFVLRAINDSQEAALDAHGGVVLRKPIHAWSTLSALKAGAAPESQLQEESMSQSESHALPLLSAQLSVHGGGLRLENPRANVRKAVRALNFQLLQLVRPEYLLLSNVTLPEEYRAEYVLRQVRSMTIIP